MMAGLFGGYRTRKEQLDAMEKKSGTASKKSTPKKKVATKKKATVKKEPVYVLDKKTGRYVQK